MSDDVAEKYLDELIETKKLDDFINAKDYKFRKLGLRFQHSFKNFKTGMKEINHYIIDSNGKKILQGTSSIDKEGILFNVFDVSFDYKGQDISKAMYELIKKYNFEKIECSFPAKSMKDNYDAFMKVYKNVLDNKVEAALSTPAGKSITKIFENKFKPTNITITEGKNVNMYWEKK
ncbi:hypothetical protein [Flavobacterium sp. 9AF]|uniref:hypothetical protein n=1 Tax=Flavobacterium sp. 9AF TaxID=2653142 RepID=UPI001F1AA75D|nr:hypothetical protein [Flavobacterium sp. 9AF]